MPSALLWAKHPLLKPSGSFVRDGESALLENFANSQQPLAPPRVGGLQPFLRCWIPASLLPPPLVPAGILGAPFLVRVPAVGVGAPDKEPDLSYFPAELTAKSSWAGSDQTQPPLQASLGSPLPRPGGPLPSPRPGLRSPAESHQ